MPLHAFRFDGAHHAPTKLEPRYIADPELPDDSDEKLFFTIINMDFSNISELRRLTCLEMKGQIDEAGLKEFTKVPRGVFGNSKECANYSMRKHLSFFLDQAGGILDPKAQLSIGDVGGAGGIGKIMDVMGSAGKQAKKNNKNPKGPKGKGEEGDVVQAMSNNGVYMYIGLMCMFPLAGTA